MTYEICGDNMGKQIEKFNPKLTQYWKAKLIKKNSIYFYIYKKKLSELELTKKTHDASYAYHRIQ